MLKPLLIGLSLVLVAMPLSGKATETASASTSAVKTLEWMDLLPDDDREKMENLPQVSHEGGEGAGSAINKTSSQFGDVMQSAKVRSELNGKKVRLPGFVVPIEYDAEQNITSFFLVPYFGACIHVPPPPPNQIVFVSNAKGLKADMIYNPFWIEGTLTTDTMSHDLANSAYSLKADKISEYDGE